MSQPLIVRNTISVKASPSKVWDALTNPSQTKKYMFGCEALSDWKEGSAIVWKGNFDGVELVAVKGVIVKIQQETFLAYTTIDPNSQVPDLPENYLTVTYELTEQDEQTILTITQGDYRTVAEGDKRYEETMAGGGWTPILQEVRKLVESPE